MKRMDGVLVSAKRDSSNVTVVTDRQGRYSFPRERVPAGSYAIRIRAIGYELGDTTVKLEAGRTAHLNLKLHKTKRTGRFS